MLGNGGAAGHRLARFHIALQGIADAFPVEAGVLGEMGVFGYQYGPLQVIADLIIIAPVLLHVALLLGAVHISAVVRVVVLQA